MSNEAYSAIVHRRSCRSFRSGALAPAQVEELLRAAFCAPFAAENSRHYAVVQNRGTLTRINRAAKQAALHLGMPHLEALGASPAFDCLYGAPLAIIISGSRQSVAPESDCAAAAENILLAAQTMGLGGCWIFFPLLAFEGEDKAAWLAELAIPDGCKPLATVAIGHRQGPPAPPAARTEPVSYIY